MEFINNKGENTMSKTELQLINEGMDDYLRLNYEENDGSMTYEDIFFMDQNQLADFIADNVDWGSDLYGGGDSGEELSIATNVCYLPDSGETFITRDDYYLLDRYGCLEKAAELVRSLTGAN